MTKRMRLIAWIRRGCLLLLIPTLFVHAAESVQTSANEARKAGTYANWAGESTEDLHLACPGFLKPLAERGDRGGFTEQCETRLDQEFLDKIPMSIPISAKDYTLSWRHVFDDPMVKRRIVLDTLSDPICMNTSGYSSGDELEDRCNATLTADYAVLKYKCTVGLLTTRKFIVEGFKVPTYLSTFDRIFDSDSYWEHRSRLEYGYYREAWINAKCAGVPDEALASLGVFDDTLELGGNPAQGQENWWWAEQGFEAYELMGVAGQFSSNLVQTEYGYEKESLSAWQRVEPVITELLKVKNPGYFQSLPAEEAARLKHFIAAQTWAKMRQRDIDKDWLIRQVGEFSDEALKQAADEAIAMMAKQGVGETWF